jgi:precorrin-6B methylase 2
VTGSPRDLIDDVANGYQASQILFTANRLGLFAAVGAAAKSHLELARELGASPRGTRILCDALVNLGLLELREDGYSAGGDVRRHLLPDSPEPRSALLLHASKLYERWGGLFDAVKSGDPIGDDRLDPRLIGSPKDFARAMSDVGRRSARATREMLGLDGVESLLDLGGGPGIYAIEFASAWPQIEVTILDTPEALGVARRNVDSVDLGDRIHLLPGDAFVDPLGGPYQVIFISNLIHIYSASENKQLIARCSEALAPGGRLVLKDFFLDEDRQQPAGGAIFAVNMLVSTEGGDCYTIAETRTWMEKASLELQTVVDVASKSRLLIATKIDA